MNLIEVRKKNDGTQTLVFRLRNGRIAASYPSGYVRITAAWLGAKATPKSLNDGQLCYQLNKTVDVQYKYEKRKFVGTEYGVKVVKTGEIAYGTSKMRILIEDEADRIEFIKEFEKRNCK